MGGTFDHTGTREFILKFSPKELLIPQNLSFDIKELDLFVNTVEEDYFYEGLRVILEDMKLYSAKGLGFEREEELLPFGGYTFTLRAHRNPFCPLWKNQNGIWEKAMLV